MIRSPRAALTAVVGLLLGLPVLSAQLTEPAGTRAPQSMALINGQWFNGTGFEPRTVYSAGGRFTSARPARVDRTLDLAGNWIIPPFGEAHNHNIDGAVEERTREALRRYVADGVFYVKIQGNYPLADDARRRLPMNRPDAPDVLLAQPFLTASEGHPILLHEEVLLKQGYYPGVEKLQLKDRLYFTIDSEGDLNAKWPQILALKPDFIKTNLWDADQFAARKDDPRYLGTKGLNPALLARIVARARRDRLRVSVHITSAPDFHYAVEAGVDEIVHSAGPSPFNTIDPAARDSQLMRDPVALSRLFIETLRGDAGRVSAFRPIDAEDAKRAAERGIVVITTIGGVTRLPENVRPVVRPATAANLRVLRDQGVRLAIGSDNIADTSLLEFEQLATLGVFDNVTLLKMWTETTPRAIFPDRQIGMLRDGYEASFLALTGNPLENLGNVRQIRLRFKQGVQLD